MFKNILPTSSKNSASTSKQSPVILIGPQEWPSVGKENQPKIDYSKKQTPWVASTTRRSIDVDLMQAAESGATHRAFERMLDDLQIPSTLRPKLATLETPVKAAMIKSSKVLNVKDPSSPPITPRPIRKARSSTSLDSGRPTQSRAQSMFYDAPYDGRTPPRSSSNLLASAIDSPFVSVDTLAQYGSSSLDLPRSMSYATLPTPHDDAPLLQPISKMSAKEKAAKDKEREQSATRFSQMLSGTKSTNLDVEKVKKLRLMLRNESAGWSELFLRAGGYAALLSRLTELLEVEWREEQRDDKILHELLRCFKALSTSSIGCFALRSSCPTPFVQLISLLYSDKKPGDLCSRQLIMDLLLILFELYPSTAASTTERKGVVLPGSINSSFKDRRDVYDGGFRPTLQPRMATTTSATSSSSSTSRALTPPPGTYPLPSPHSSLPSLIHALLLTPAPLPAEAPSLPLEPHAFIASLHVSRVYKPYLTEVGDVVRDYFWVFCHPQNAIWALDKVDEESVERPRAPGGMTGGVEYEAVGYLTSHMRFINAYAQRTAELDLPASDELSAHQLHTDLFASGIERIITTMRKASTSYYPTLHLEIARYITHAAKAKFDLPWTVSRLVGPPPSAVLKTVPTKIGAGPGSPSRREGSRFANVNVEGRMGSGVKPGEVGSPVLPRIERMGLLD